MCVAHRVIDGAENGNCGSLLSEIREWIIEDTGRRIQSKARDLWYPGGGFASWSEKQGLGGSEADEGKLGPI